MAETCAARHFVFSLGRLLDIEMELKNKGMEIEVRTPQGVFQGDLVIDKTGLTWCNGKTTKKNGLKKSWEEVIAFFGENR